MYFNRVCCVEFVHQRASAGSFEPFKKMFIVYFGQNKKMSDDFSETGSDFKFPEGQMLRGA